MTPTSTVAAAQDWQAAAAASAWRSPLLQPFLGCQAVVSVARVRGHGVLELARGFGERRQPQTTTKIRSCNEDVEQSTGVAEL